MTTRVAVIDDAVFVRRVADYERISGIAWIVLACLQIISVYGAIAGIWNLIAGSSRLGLVKRINARDPSVPGVFEPVLGLIIIGIVNLFIGGVIGVLFVGFDLYIRDQVLSHRRVFEGSPTDARAPRVLPTT